MPEDGTEKSEGVEMKDLTSTSFGYAIAFLLPGMLGLYSLSYWSNGVHQLIQPALRADATIGPSAMLLVIALGIGLCISALRFLVFERMLCRKYSFPKDMFAKLQSSNRLVSFKSVVDGHYRYHQFYGGCAVAFFVMYGGWVLQNYSELSLQFVFITLGFVTLEWLLTYTAVGAFKRYVERGTTVVKGETAVTPHGAHHQTEGG